MRVLKACISFLVVLMFFSGCGGKEVEQETKDAFKSTNEEMKNDETLDLCIIQADTLNPLRTTVRHNAEVLSLLYDSLFVLSDENEAVPNLCTNLLASEDGRKVTLTIRENVCFQDGTMLKPRDVVATVLFILESEGFYKERISCVESARTNGEKVELFLKKETENIACLLDFPILPEKFLKSFEERAVLEPPITGSGLYFLEEYRINQVIKLKVNPKHHSGSAPKYEKMNLHLLPDEKTAICMLENKEIDVLSERALVNTVYTPPPFVSSVPYATDRLVFLGSKEERFSTFSKSLKTSMMSWVTQENIGKVSKEISVSTEAEHKEAFRGKNTLIYCLDRFVQTRTAQEILRETEKNGDFITGEGVAKKEYFSRIQNCAYDLFLGETQILPNRDKNDFLQFQNENSPAKMTGLFFANEQFYFQKEIAVDDVKTKNPYLYFTERQ